ncbi:hypothetical protein PIROE2DRAFT_15252 [Piromyces sp. E2]|nr:hypothetical protein PIROE2DRAFT_15252 [Piromyces sp. E2]|eukprot:OUM59258.1 hypothetical protein PIROE2DRAFT_15252 [Piromyces sp. E2]
MNLLKIFTFLIIVASTLAAPITLKSKYKISYKKATNVNFYKNLSLDVYYNERNFKKSTELPVVIFIHGGFWLNGDKSTYNKAGELLQKEGYVVVIPNYTVFINNPNVTIDDMVDDIYHAVEWTFNNISKYGGDHSKITLSGHSSGAHLAALTLIKTDFGIKNNGKILNKLPVLKHALFLNAPYTIDLNEAIKQLNGANLGQIALGLMKLFTNAKNTFPLDILTSMNKRINSLSAKQVTILDTENDLLIPSIVAKAFMIQIQRTTKKTSVDYVLLQDSNDAVKPDAYGGHNRIIVNLFDSHKEIDVSAKNLLLNVIEKYNKSNL